MVTCYKCEKSKSDSQFNYKNIQLNLRSKTCKECSRKAVKSHYERNKSYYLRKALKRNTRIINENQKFLLGFLAEHPCVDCGEDDPIVLEFDHIRNKSTNVSEMLRLKYSNQRLTEEIEKCEIRCANCHRRKNARERQWYKHKNAPVA